MIVTAAMDEATPSAWCREQGLYPAELDAWKRDAIAGLGEPQAASAVEAQRRRPTHHKPLRTRWVNSNEQKWSVPVSAETHPTR